MKEPAVNVGKFFEFVAEVTTAFLFRRIEHFKKSNQGFAKTKAVVFESVKIIVEHFVFAENVGGFGVQAENEPDAKPVETSQSFIAVLVDVLRSDFIVKFAD